MHSKVIREVGLIGTRSKKQIKDLFDRYANEDHQFDRADYKVKLTADREFLSRSQAKRILMGLESYQKLIFDFAKVKMIGQAFADEIFRVFQNRYPKIDLTFCNANEAITGMILRAIRSQSLKNKQKKNVPKNMGDELP